MIRMKLARATIAASIPFAARPESCSRTLEIASAAVASWPVELPR